MKYANEKAVTATGQSLRALCSIPEDIKSGFIILQAPLANGANIFFGNDATQPAFIKPEGAAEIRFADPSDVYVKGTAPDTIIILVL